MAEIERVHPPEGSLPQANTPTAFIFDGMAILQMVKAGGSRTLGDLAEKQFSFVKLLKKS